MLDFKSLSNKVDALINELESDEKAKDKKDEREAKVAIGKGGKKDKKKDSVEADRQSYFDAVKAGVKAGAFKGKTLDKAKKFLVLHEQKYGKKKKESKSIIDYEMGLTKTEEEEMEKMGKETTDRFHEDMEMERNPKRKTEEYFYMP